MRRLMTIAWVCLAVAASAAAQEQRGSIEGVVKDSSGAVLPGTTVEATSPTLVGAQSTTADAQGVYRFPALPPGKYTINATLQGFRPTRVENVTVALGQILKVDLTLALGGVSETVDVKAESPLIDVKQNAASTSIGQEVIERIPKGRDFTNLVAYQAAGAEDEPRGGGVQIDGASGSENRFVVDGMDTTSLRSGLSQRPVLTDFLQEVQVKSSGYNAEYRASTGGVISAITKNGGNRYRGTFGTYFTSDNLRGDIRPSLRLNPSNQTIAESIVVPPDDYTTWEPLFDIGGPIRQDKAWFYLGYIPQVQHTERTVTFQSNRQTQTFVQDTRDHNLNYNVSSQVLKNLRARFAGSNERIKGAPSFPSIEPDATSRDNPALFQGERQYTNGFADSYSGVVDWVATPKLYVNVTTGYFGYGSRGEGPVGTSLRHTFSASNFQFTDIPASLQNSSGYADAISSSIIVKDDYGRITFNSDATYYARWKGDHTLKGGFQYERLSNDVNRGQQYPSITLNWDAVRGTLDGRNVRGKYGYYTVTRGTVTLGDFAVSNVGVFIQDAWTVNNRLTLNLGLRTEREDVPSYKPENPGIHFSFADKIAPRVGFAWDLKGDSTWKTYASWGVFHDLMKLSLSRILFGADRWVDYFYTLDTFDWPSIQCSYPPVSGPSCPGTFIEQADFRHEANDRDNSLIDPGLKPMRSQEFTVGMDHELNRTTSVGVRYVHKWLNRAIEAFGVLLPGVGEIYRVANPGYGWDESPLTDPFISPGLNCTTCPNQPPAKRVYDGLEFRLRKRFADNWELTTSYTLSRLYGNYSGLANSDESINGSARTDPNSSRGFDQLTESFDAKGQPVFGRLQTDRPHVFKAQGSYDFKWGTSVGANFIVQSGTPVNTQMNHLSGIFFYPFGRGDLGRTPVYSQTDLLAQHTVGLPGRARINASINVENLFDQDTVTSIYPTVYRDNINIPFQDFFLGFDPNAYAAAARLRPDARFTLPAAYQQRRTIRVMAKILF
jgi:carboxypeptidase family protein/TonB-dependent receptor-like protein